MVRGGRGVVPAVSKIIKAKVVHNMIPNSTLEDPFLAQNQTVETGVSFKGVAFLAVTIGLEISGTLLIRKAVEDSRFFAFAFGLYFAGLAMFSYTLRTLPLSIAYTTWCALGTVGVTIGSQYLYCETISTGRWICILGTIPLVVGMYTLD